MTVIVLVLYETRHDNQVRVITKYGTTMDIPEGLIRSDIPLALYVKDERHVFKEPTILWDQKLGCIVEVVWPKADDYESGNRSAAAEIGLYKRDVPDAVASASVDPLAHPACQSE